jgi:hypothetical protein
MRGYANCSTTLGEPLARFVVCSAAAKLSRWPWLSTDYAKQGASRKMMRIS